MRFYTTGHIAAATERPGFRERADLDLTVLMPDLDGAEVVHIFGAPAERGAYLRLLAKAAIEAADHIDRVGVSA